MCALEAQVNGLYTIISDKVHLMKQNALNTLTGLSLCQMKWKVKL